MKRILSFLLSVLLVAVMFAGCAGGQKLNGVNIADYTIVYSDDAPDYCKRAAEYIAAQILERTGVTVAISEDNAGTNPHEIVVGETNRAISQTLDAETENVEFAILADDNHIALEGDYFIIAAAAYYFVETYIPGKSFQSDIPKTVSIHTPITEKAKNFIYLIGDGMSFNHTKLLEEYEIADFATDSDNERIFYGYYLPYQGRVHTDSLSGVTDSAAGGTALACGYKTLNYYVGKDKDGKDIQSLTELAVSQGKATAVLSTDLMTGATPAAFSAHAMDRNDSNAILSSAKVLMEKGTIMLGGLQFTDTYQDIISETLTELEANENGFFIMYEEGYIDKFAHKMQIEDTLLHMGRFNQAIGIFMEYAFYHPDTFLIITADHETGALMPNKDGKLEFFSNSHTGADVPIFGYGQGAEVFQDYDEENNEVPKVIAALWGVEDFGG